MLDSCLGLLSHSQESSGLMAAALAGAGRKLINDYNTILWLIGKAHALRSPFS